jgi:hypothetical protein
VLQDVVSYEETQEVLALLKILSLGMRDVEAGRGAPLDEVMRDLLGEADRGRPFGVAEE